MRTTDASDTWESSTVNRFKRLTYKDLSYQFLFIIACVTDSFVCAEQRVMKLWALKGKYYFQTQATCSLALALTKPQAT